MRNIHLNKDAGSFIHQRDSDGLAKIFHSQLPGFECSPLTPLPETVIGTKHIYVKDESERLGLPSFKILGASWGVFRAITARYDLPINSDLAAVKQVVQQHKTRLVAATDGNHGRAVAHMARMLDTSATIFVPESVDNHTREKISDEGADVVVEPHDYDTTVKTAYKFAVGSRDCLFVQDTSFDGYETIPKWIVEGYTTMLEEIEEQLGPLGLKATHIFTPVGVGSLAHAVVNHSKSGGRAITVVAVEAETAACLQHSLRSGYVSSISTSKTIMDGLNCGTVSDISWTTLKNGVDAAITISDHESHRALLQLSSIGIKSGPCGAAPFAALQKVLGTPVQTQLGLDESSVVVLLCTEGPRAYNEPAQAVSHG